MKRKNKAFCLLLLMIVLSHCIYAQNGHLSKKITIHLTRVSLQDALNEVGRAGYFRFSYDADLIKGCQPVTVDATDITVGKVLKEILGGKAKVKEVGNHVILIRNKKNDQDNMKAEEYTISGVIYCATTRKHIPNATVYEVEKKSSALTAQNGAYSMLIPGGKMIRGICFSKTGFMDTVIFVKKAENRQIDILLKPVENDLTRIEPIASPEKVYNIDSMGFVNWFVPEVTRINSVNLVVHTTRPFQVSIIPYVGSNWKVTGSITNKFSLNILAGYTGGLKGFELGGLLNITRNDINGVQMGGLGNIVGSKGKGWQIGGLFNYDLGKFAGVQIGGLLNYVTDTISGVQIGGLTNILTGTIKGVQISGLTNVVTKNSDGWQISGLLNLTLKDVKQVQMAGLVNFGRNMDGVQVAGLVNIARNHNDGVQIAGLFNYATIVTGLQLGIINVSNTVERGIPIGLFSYVQEGYHLFEISGNEIFYGNVAFKSGTTNFYNMVGAGIGGDYKLNLYYGLGTIFTLRKKLSMNIDASAGFVYHPTGTIYHGLLLKFNPALEYRFAKHFAVFMGPAYNFFLFPKGEPSATSRGLSTYDFYFKSTENASIQMWIGGVLGIRF